MHNMLKHKITRSVKHNIAVIISMMK